MYSELYKICEEIIIKNEDLYLSEKCFSFPISKYKKYKFTVLNSREDTIFNFLDCKIKDYKLNYVRSTENNDNCCVCFEDTNIETNCCHKKICMQCVEGWKNSIYNSNKEFYTCPHCRRGIKKDNSINRVKLNVAVKITKDKIKGIIEKKDTIMSRIQQKNIFCC